MISLLDRYVLGTKGNTGFEDPLLAARALCFLFLFTAALTNITKMDPLIHQSVARTQRRIRLKNREEILKLGLVILLPEYSVSK